MLSKQRNKVKVSKVAIRAAPATRVLSELPSWQSLTFDQFLPLDWDFPGGSVSKESACNAGEAGDTGSTLG